MVGMKPRSPFRNKAIYSIGLWQAVLYERKEYITHQKQEVQYTVYCWEQMHVTVTYVLNARGNASDSTISIHAKAI